MMKCSVISDSNAKELLNQGYESILNSAAEELSATEYKHLADIADVGYEHATRKGEYIEALQHSVWEWTAEVRRERLYVVNDSMEIDFLSWYNKTSEVEKQMNTDHRRTGIPTFFVCFGAVVLALFCCFATIFIMGIFQKSFLFNPVYLFMLTAGFLGLLLTDIVAVAEWRKGRNAEK